MIETEWNPERKAYYQLLWHLGGSQSDIANLNASDIDWDDRTIAYRRNKTKVISIVHFSESVVEILKNLPAKGPLFPRMSQMHEKHRATEFKNRCKKLKIHDITLHSYRYAWAERAKESGYPERFAQAALGHNSKSVARAYAKKAQVIIPSLDDYEKAHQEGRKKTVSINSK